MLSWEQVQAAVRPLRLIFWGGILWLIDFSFSSTTNGEGFRCDVLDDTVGTVLITVALFRLSAAPVPGRYASVMFAIKVIAICSVVETVIKHFIFPHPAPLDFIFGVLGLAQLLGTVLFCMAMKWFCIDAGMIQVAESWRVTFLLFCFLNALPLGLLNLASMFAMITDSSFHVNLGPAGLLLLPVILLPLIHLFISTSRMRRAAEVGLTSPPGGFPVVLPSDSSSD